MNDKEKTKPEGMIYIPSGTYRMGTPVTQVSELRKNIVLI
jgi:hypothetical protein